MEPSRPKQLRFEDYLSFFNNSCADHLTVSQLNQILFIHGFVKLNHHRKVDVIDAVSSLSLIPPTRSTICATTGIAQLSVSCMSPLSLLGLKRDMLEIEWQECPIGSVATINPVALHASDDSISPPSCLTALPGREGRWRDMVRESIKQDEERNSIALPATNGKEDAVAKVTPKMEKTTHVAPLRRKKANGYSWKNAGVKILKGVRTHRKYYSCRMSDCKAKKYVDCDLADPSVYNVTYKGEHNHTIS